MLIAIGSCMNNMYACMVGLIQPVAGADPAGGWVTICMNLCMYICMHICNYTYTIVYNVHAWTYVHVYRCVHDGGYMYGEG